jgi:hypothetical protein
MSDLESQLSVARVPIATVGDYDGY